MVRRYELSDRAFPLVEDLLPPNGRRGGQWKCHRTMLNSIFWILYTSARWRELPEPYGRWKSVYNRWRADGTADRMLERLQLKLDEQGRIDVDLWCIDATLIRASRAAAGAAGEKRSG